MYALLALFMATAGAVPARVCTAGTTPCQGVLGPVVRQADAQGSNVVSRPVHVDVIAVDGKGRTLENLKAADFEIAEDGVPQTLDEVRLVRVDGRGDAAAAREIESAVDERAEGGRTDVRLFAIFLDEYHVDGAQTARVREALDRFLGETLGPRDLVIVRRPLDSVLTIRMTRDREEARRLVAQFSGRKNDYRPANDYERNYFAGTPARIEQLRDQVTTSALHALALHLGSLNQETRKTLVVVSEGLARVANHRGLEALPTFDAVIRAANRSNVAVYAVDPREGRPNAPSEGDVLPTLVAATGGRSIAAEGDLSAALEAVGSDASAYYLLTYRSRKKADAAFHELRVSVKKAGAAIRTRNGYWATPPDEGMRASLAASALAVPLGPPRHISPLIQAWFGASRGADGKTRVTFVWEPAAKVPGDRSRRTPPSLVVLKVLGVKNATLFEGPVKPTGAGRADRAGDQPMRAVFDVPPGSLRLEMAIEDASSQALDSDVREISVRDLTARVALGTPEVLRARTAKDYRAIESDPDAVPVVSREFSRTERLLIRVPAYGPPDVPVTLTARLLSRSGQPMRVLDVRGAPESPTISQIDLSLASLAAGEYFVDIAGTSAAGNANERLPFRVTN